MSHAASIASQGRTGKVSSITIATSGRIYIALGAIALVKTEILNIISTVRTILDIESRLG